MKYVCVKCVMDVVFSVCIVTHGAVGARALGSMSVSSCNSIFTPHESLICLPNNMVVMVSVLRLSNSILQQAFILITYRKEKGKV